MCGADPVRGSALFFYGTFLSFKYIPVSVQKSSQQLQLSGSPYAQSIIEMLSAAAEACFYGTLTGILEDLYVSTAEVQKIRKYLKKY